MGRLHNYKEVREYLEKDTQTGCGRRRRFPAADVIVREMPPPEQIIALLDRQIDLGFVGLPVIEVNADLIFEPIHQAPQLVALPPGHRFRILDPPFLGC